MPSLVELRERSAQLFTDLLVAQTTRPLRRRRGRRALAAAPPPRRFSWFDPDDAAAASALAFRLSAFAASTDDREDGLGAALDHADEARTGADPELVRQGLALFVTHNDDGRRLLKPRTVVAAPALFRPPPARGRPPAVAIGGASPGLDYWREDALANEHHQHWHEVYPYSGLPPADFRMWVQDTGRADIAAILTAADPGQDWPTILAGMTDAQIANLFATNIRAFSRLPPDLYRKLFRLNDRQGELFFYMHRQMLARYDAELLSNGLPPVDRFAKPQWSTAIDEGHDPIGLARFFRRDQNQQLPQARVAELSQLEQEIQAALVAGTLDGPAGQPVPIDRTNLGEAVEATTAQLRELDLAAYRGLHNFGHGFIAELSDPNGGPGVMTSTTTAIRDQIFWRWHKHIDDLGAGWQETQQPMVFDDAPPVLIRDRLGAGAAQAWASPDVILVTTIDLPAGRTEPELEQLGNELFGGPAWDTDFAGASATSGSTTVPTTDTLTTSMRNVNFGGRSVKFLTHEPFSYFLRLENTAPVEAGITVRVFLAPEATAADRRAWIEMDKFMVTIPAETKRVVYRPDTESSVIKRPAETGPSSVTSGTPTSSEGSYCDCGWPYTLLLPRGTPAGMPFRLLVICTDGVRDQVEMPDHCGSMSYCGSMDRYPDARDMGYPFARRFDGPAATAIGDATLSVASMAARSVTIRHA